MGLCKLCSMGVSCYYFVCYTNRVMDRMGEVGSVANIYIDTPVHSITNIHIDVGGIG